MRRYPLKLIKRWREGSFLWPSVENLYQVTLSGLFKCNASFVSRLNERPHHADQRSLQRVAVIGEVTRFVFS